MDIPKHILDKIDVKFDDNPTYPSKVTIKPKVTQCADCKQEVSDRGTHKRLVQNPQPHWVEKCTACNKYRNPYNGNYELSGGDLRSFYIDYFRKR